MPRNLRGWNRRTWVALGVGIAVLVGLIAWSWWAEIPPRAVFQAPDKSWPQGFTPDGRSFLTLSPEGVVAWDTAAWKARAPWATRAFRIFDFAGDSRTCVGEHGYDAESAQIAIVDSSSGAIRQTFRAGLPQVLHLGYIDGDRSIRAFLADRAGQFREVVTWDLATGAETRLTPQGPVRKGIFAGGEPAGYARDGRVVAYLDLARGGIQLWDVGTDQPIGNLLVNPGAPLGWNWSNVIFTPDGQQAVVGRLDGAVDVWDVATSKLIRTIAVHPDSDANRDLQISPDGRTLVSTGQFHHATTWPDRALIGLHNLTRGSNRSFRDEVVVVVDLATGQRLARWPGAFHPRYAPDSRTIVTQQSWTGTFAVRDVPEPVTP